MDVKNKVEDTAASSVSTILLVVGVPLLQDPAIESKVVGLLTCALAVGANYVKYTRRDGR